MENNKHHPGTVSRILWHFTGGPKWNEQKNRQNKRKKPAREAFQNIINILKTKKLKLGQYSEVLNVMKPEIFNKTQDNNRKTDENSFKQIKSSPVCCLADVPIMHLEYLAERYGKFAIGFRRKSVINNDFNPVLYTLSDKKIIRNIFDSLDILSALSRTEKIDITIQPEKLVDDHSMLINKLHKGFRNLLAYVKTFKEEEFHTVYCEREWRSIREYNFKDSDIALIIIPKKVGKNYYYDSFCNKYIDRLEIPKSIPVVPWEDIIEY